MIDKHKQTAAELFRCKESEVTTCMRRVGKTFNFFKEYSAVNPTLYFNTTTLDSYKIQHMDLSKIEDRILAMELDND